MGRWLEKARKRPDDVPTKLTEPGFVGFVSTPSSRFQEKAPVELVAANEITPPWLHLLALADDRVVQRCGEQSTERVEGDARLQYGDDLLAVVAVHGFERPLTEAEIVKALAGTLAAPAAPPPPSSVWLVRVARLLGIRSAELLEGGYLEQHDLAELAGTDVALVADQIRHSPAWLNRPQYDEQPEAGAAPLYQAAPIGAHGRNCSQR